MQMNKQNTKTRKPKNTKQDGKRHKREKIKIKNKNKKGGIEKD